MYSNIHMRADGDVGSEIGGDEMFTNWLKCLT